MNLAISTLFLACSIGEPIEPSPRSPIPPISSEILYLSSGILFESLSWIAKIGQHVTNMPNECHLLSEICHRTADRAFSYALQGAFPHNYLPSSYLSWTHYHKALSTIPASTEEEQQLLSFLTNRWLAKSAGYISFLVNWVSPCFGIFLQVTPETSHGYARSPLANLSKTYINRMEAWKHKLPHPEKFPLVLTRPVEIGAHLPYHTILSSHEAIETTLRTLSKTTPLHILDTTPLFSSEEQDPQKWRKKWDAFALDLFISCQKLHIPLSSLCCIQRVSQKNIGGIRILPLPLTSEKDLEKHHTFFLERITLLGLSANRIELDRESLMQNNPSFSYTPIVPRTKKELLSYFASFPSDFSPKLPAQKLMLQATLQILKGLLLSLDDDTWEKMQTSNTRSYLVSLSFSEIHKLLEEIHQQENKFSFSDLASHIEQIHCHISTLLEIFSPCGVQDFSKTCRNLFSFLPPDLLSLASFGVHSSGMSSISGILKSTELSLGSPPHVLYGENTYYEIIHALDKTGCKIKSIEQAQKTDWKQTDLLLTQFHPVWQATAPKKAEYELENVEQNIRTLLLEREGKPFTVAIDCTIDFLHSPQIERIAETFEEEIREGRLNLICYRSGIKFDLLGMDHFCGAPYMMIHNRDPHWNTFDFLQTNLALQTDPLSLNWFSLAYKYIPKELDLYRKQIFDLTRLLLDKTSNSPDVSYHIVASQSQAYPYFIDITVSGTGHPLRTSIIAGYITLRCLEEKIPLSYRSSFGMYHTNLSILFGKERSSIRITLGPDPGQIPVLSECLDTINALNKSDSTDLHDLTRLPF